MLKVTVVGGGSTYTPELVSGLLARLEIFPLTELRLMDIDAERLEIVGGFAKQMVEARGNPFRVSLSTELRAALERADYVITQLRVGQMEARRLDEYLGARHGLIGQETTGVGGMAKALRTIPVILQVADLVRDVGQPGALLVNFTNPAGLVTQALSQYAADIPAVGVCNVPITAKMDFLKRLEAQRGRASDPRQVELDTLGLNHLSWHRGLTICGEDVWGHVLEGTLEELRHQEQPLWDPRLIEVLGMIPNYYLQYFYETERMLKAQQQWPPSRAEEVIAVEKDLLAQYADPNLQEPPADMMKRGGAWYSTMALELLSAHYNDLGEVHIVNTRSGGAVKDWPEAWVLEMPARVNRAAIRPLPAEPLPLAQYGLLAQVKAYEMLTVEAAVHGDMKAAYQALLAHPLGPPASQVQQVLDDLLQVNRPYLPQFWA